MDTIRIVPTAEQFIAGLHRCVDAVARERRYLGFTEAPPLAASRAFVQALLAGAGIQFVAVGADERVIGWCDIVRDTREGFRHCGRLGMGMLPEARGKGLGTRLARAAIDRAWSDGLERIELEVFASNERAIELYRRLGFVTEGVKRRARKLDGQYDDNVLMALMRVEPRTSELDQEEKTDGLSGGM
jgi:RimJ/RimL family protein N-acetyltransferase